MSLNQLISKDADLNQIAAFLDDLDPTQRLSEIQSLKKKAQIKLYEIASTGHPIDLSYFVSSDIKPQQEVIHNGRNTIPLTKTFRHFQKRFCRPEDKSSRLFGYNHGATMGLIGPGFFVAVPTSGNSDWEARGSVVIDYFQTPDGPVADGWPNVIPNSKGLQRFVYYQTRDFMRRVSTHVSVGAAYKVEKSLGQFFMLCREEN